MLVLPYLAFEAFLRGSSGNPGRGFVFIITTEIVELVCSGHSLQLADITRIDLYRSSCRAEFVNRRREVSAALGYMLEGVLRSLQWRTLAIVVV